MQTLPPLARRARLPAAATTRSAATSAATAATAARPSSRWPTTPANGWSADFGHIHVDFPEGRRLVPVLVTAWAYSNYAFALALPTERTEAILAGMVAASRSLAACPARSGGITPRPWSGSIFKGRERRPNDVYAGPGQPLRLRAAVLHAGRGQREASRRDPRPGPATAVGHARAAGRRPGCLERSTCGSAAVAEAEPHGGRLRRSRSASVSPATGPEALPLPAHPFDPCVTAAGAGGQVPDGAVRPQPLQRAAGLCLPGGDGQGLRRPRRGGRRRPGGGAAQPQLRPGRAGPRPAALPGDAGT